MFGKTLLCSVLAMITDNTGQGNIKWMIVFAITAVAMDMWILGCSFFSLV